jgi:citrate lyase subunit beta/citryl-CoA lyase
MSGTFRLRRSVLYMPGSNARAIEKARTLPADALILDLEDSVAPDAKSGARDQVCAAVQDGGFGDREVVVRINGLDTPWGPADLEAAAKAGPDAVLVPKVNDGAAIGEACVLLEGAGAARETALWAMMETPIAMLRAQEIAGAGGRLAGLVMGTNDLAKELGTVQTEARTPMITSLALCLLAARAFRLTIIDGVYNEIENLEGFESVCRQGRELGFDGKTLIHPTQIEICNRVFSPAPEAVEEARAVIAAFDGPEARERGVVKLGGRMVERLHLEQAEQLVAMAEAIEARTR